MIVDKIQEAVTVAAAAAREAGARERACIAEINSISKDDVRGIENPVSARIQALDIERRAAQRARRSALHEAAALQNVLKKMRDALRG